MRPKRLAQQTESGRRGNRSVVTPIFNNLMAESAEQSNLRIYDCVFSSPLLVGVVGDKYLHLNVTACSPRAAYHRYYDRAKESSVIIVL
jgi:hypothetical protein